jgi:hypothetical protein
MANARAEAPMSSRFQCQFLLLAAAGLLLAGCSARTDVAPAQPSGPIAPVHARAAQRVELPGADAAAVANESAALASGTRIQPATPEVLRFPDGTVGIKVAQQYYHTIVACRLPDGSFTTQCAAGKEPRP